MQSRKSNAMECYVRLGVIGRTLTNNRSSLQASEFGFDIQASENTIEILFFFIESSSSPTRSVLKYKKLFPMFQELGFDEFYATTYEHMVRFYEYFGCEVVGKRTLNERNFYLMYYSGN